MHTLPYVSLNHDALSNGFIFTLCSKYTWALVQSYLIGWGLIWFLVWEEEKQSGDVVTVFCYTLSVFDRHSGCVTVTFLSCVSRCQTTVGESLWFDWLRFRASNLLPGLRGSALCSCIRVSMCLCCVWVQVIIWELQSVRFIFFWAQPLMAHSPVKMDSSFQFIRSWSFKWHINCEEDLQQCVCISQAYMWIHVSLIKAPWLNMSHAAVQSLVLAWWPLVNTQGQPNTRLTS